MSVWPERVGQSTLAAGTLLDVDLRHAMGVGLNHDKSM